MAIDVWVGLIIFVAVFVQATAGFGLALVSMPLLTAVIGLTLAAPLVAIFGMLAEAVILVRFRESFNVRAVGRLVLAALLGTAVGLYLLGVVAPAAGARLLGLVVAGYALYALLTPRLPLLAHAGWAWGFGFVAGVIGGLYNTSGPPVIIFGSCRRWSPPEFKGNLQGFFLPVGIFVLAGHVLQGNVTPDVWHYVWVAIPAMALGLGAGFMLDGRIPVPLFRRLVLLLLLIVGLRLLLA